MKLLVDILYVIAIVYTLFNAFLTSRFTLTWLT